MLGGGAGVGGAGVGVPGVWRAGTEDAGERMLGWEILGWGVLGWEMLRLMVLGWEILVWWQCVMLGGGGGESGEPGVPHPRVCPIRLRRGLQGTTDPAVVPPLPAVFPLAGLWPPAPRDRQPRGRPRAGFGPGGRRVVGTGGCAPSCHRCVPPAPLQPLAVSPGGTATPCPALPARPGASVPGQKPHVPPCAPVPLWQLRLMFAGGPLPVSPVPAVPVPSCVPGDKRGTRCAGAVPGLPAAFRGGDGGCCCPALGPAALWGVALGPRPGAPPGPPHCVRGTTWQLFRLRPGFPQDGGQVGTLRGAGDGHGTRSPHPDTHFAPPTPRPSVVVGAPRANTSQPGVAQPGAVFLCSWPPGETPCHLLPMDAAGAWVPWGRWVGTGRWGGHQSSTRPLFPLPQETRPRPTTT